MPILLRKLKFAYRPKQKTFLENIIEAHEHFDFTTCNPPFHGSLEEAQAGTKRKWKNLGRAQAGKKPHEKQLVNFGGQGAELWCDGGEMSFIETMISESALFAKQCTWFSTLVSKEQTLPKIEHLLKNAKASRVRILDMSQGQKKSRIVAWSFLK